MAGKARPMLDLEGPGEGGWGGNRRRGLGRRGRRCVCDEVLLGGPSAADQGGAKPTARVRTTFRRRNGLAAAARLLGREGEEAAA